MKFGGIMEYAMCERKNTLVETRHGTSLQAHRMRLRNRVGAELAAFAGFAVQSHPHAVELLDGLRHEGGLVGEDARLEIAGVFALHADARSGEVGAADIHLLTIEHQQFEVDARTERPFHPLDERRVSVEILAEGGTGFLGVDEAHLHALPHQLCQHREERLRTGTHLHVEVFDVGGADPQRLPDGGHAGEDEVVMVGIGDVGGGHNLNVGEKSAAKITHLYENGWHNRRDGACTVSTRYVNIIPTAAPGGSQSQ